MSAISSSFISKKIPPPVPASLVLQVDPARLHHHNVCCVGRFHRAPRFGPRAG